MSKVRKTKKLDLNSPDLSEISDALYPREEKKETINAEFLIEELKKRRPFIPVVKEQISKPDPLPDPPHHTPLYPQLSEQEKNDFRVNRESKTFNDDVSLMSTRAVTTRSTQDDTKAFHITCIGSPNVVPYQMKQRNVPEMRQSRSKTTMSVVPRKISSAHAQTARRSGPMYSWKYCGETNDTLGVYTARVPLKSDPKRVAEAQSRIDNIRKVDVERKKKKKKVVKSRDLFAMSINQKDGFVSNERNYVLDYENDVCDDAIANSDVQTFLVCEDKMIPLKVSILK